MAAITEKDFDEFLVEVKPKLMKAFLGALGPNRADDALSASLEWAFRNQHRLESIDNPTGFLYRVGASRSVPPKEPNALAVPANEAMPEFEPRLVPALLNLPDTQRTAVWLIHGCGWTYPAAADAMGIGESTVGTHASRGLLALRRNFKEMS